MKISRENLSAEYSIRSYKPGSVSLSVPRRTDADESGPGPRIAVMTESFVIAPNRLVADWPPETLTEVAPEHMEVIAELNPEVVLIGSGETLRFPDPGITRLLTERAIGVEVMDTGAACRTYNVLAAEGRVVAAALLLR